MDDRLKEAGELLGIMANASAHGSKFSAIANAAMGELSKINTELAQERLVPNTNKGLALQPEDSGDAKE